MNTLILSSLTFGLLMAGTYIIEAVRKPGLGAFLIFCGCLCGYALTEAL